jgi:AcrR family transcriptional regulator
MAPHRLTPSIVLDTYVALADGASTPVTLAALGAHLGVDTSAVYRHFADKDALLAAAADHVLAPVTERLPTTTWDATVRTICTRLRRQLLRYPTLAAQVRSGPPLHPNEFRLTEALLRTLTDAGFPDEQAALAYHAIIELTVGSVALDAEIAAQSTSARRATYRRWQRVYADLDGDEFPTATRIAQSLYAGSADDRFDYALAALLAGLARP